MTRKVDTYEYESLAECIKTDQVPDQRYVEIFTDKEFYKYYKKNYLKMNIDKLLIDQIEQQTTDNNVAVLLSGGVDSLSVAFAAHRMGKKITAYTFHLQDQPSYDATKAAEVAKLMGWGMSYHRSTYTQFTKRFSKISKRSKM